MEVRRQQANYRCTLYRLQFCRSFQDMCRYRAFQMLHTQQSSSHPLGVESTIIYHALPRVSTWLNDQGTNMSSEKCRAAVNMFFTKSLLCVLGGLLNTWGRWALGPTLGWFTVVVMPWLERRRKPTYLPSGKPGNSTASHVYMRCFTCFPLR